MIALRDSRADETKVPNDAAAVLVQKKIIGLCEREGGRERVKGKSVIELPK